MAKKAPTKKTAGKKQASKKPGGSSADFPAVFARLKAILTPYAPRMVVVKDDETWYYLDTKVVGKNKRPIMFAAVRVGKGYVSFYLMCVYCKPEWIANMSPALKKRMQGKACFNFTVLDEALFAELEALTKTGAEWFLNGGLEKILKMQ
jgi:hypothetical protein